MATCPRTIHHNGSEIFPSIKHTSTMMMMTDGRAVEPTGHEERKLSSNNPFLLCVCGCKSTLMDRWRGRATEAPIVPLHPPFTSSAFSLLWRSDEIIITRPRWQRWPLNGVNGETTVGSHFWLISIQKSQVQIHWSNYSWRRNSSSPSIVPYAD